MSNLLLVGLGGAAGAVLRYTVGLMVGVHLFPYGTLIINIAGSMLIGAFWAGCSGHEWFEQWGRLLLVTGVLGGFTTFSAFSLEVVHLLNAGRMLAASAYVVGTFVGCLAGCWLGYRWLA